MLFSEPKIPQCHRTRQRTARAGVSVLFSEPKIPQSSAPSRRVHLTLAGFSALQRAENSSIALLAALAALQRAFQCSSASRKFLNPRHIVTIRRRRDVSVLFSEPKIPQSVTSSQSVQSTDVSVLFSEPKIPQCNRYYRRC